jgi:hypothetical protein
MATIGISSARRCAEDVALGALLGGNLFGRFAMGPALTDVSDASERGKVLTHAQRRYGIVNALALVVLVGGWLPVRRGKIRSASRRRCDRAAVLAKDVALGAVVATGLASAAAGVSLARQAPGGAVPMASGSETAAQAPPRAARLKRAVNMLATLNLFAELALAVVNELLEH